jgi:hypothetical protein
VLRRSLIGTLLNQKHSSLHTVEHTPLTETGNEVDDEHDIQQCTEYSWESDSFAAVQLQSFLLVELKRSPRLRLHASTM